jgi:hypothetical protein
VARCCSRIQNSPRGINNESRISSNRSAELWLLAWSGSAQPALPQVIDQGTNQGTKWNTAARQDFYSRDQGSNQGNGARKPKHRQLTARNGMASRRILRAFGGDKR